MTDRRLLRRLDALGDGVHVQIHRQTADRAHDAQAALAARGVLQERAIQLEAVHRQAVQVPQRAVAGAEVVDDDAAAELVALLDQFERRLQIVEQPRFGDLQP